MAPSSSSQECHICLEELRRDLAAAPCGHVYHHVCILQALQVNTQCPICRRRTGDADLVTLYFDVPGGDDAATSPLKPAQASGDCAELSTRVNTLMERIQWQNKHQQQLMDELRRLRNQSEQLLVDKQSQEHRVRGLQDANNELLNKVTRYQLELSRQAEAARRSSVNQSIINYLETCDAAALEEEIQNPRELIMALKKACKFRHDQYEKVVKEKARLKEMLRNTQPQFTQQPQSAGTARVGKAKSRGASVSLETKRPYPSGSSDMGFGTGIQPPVVENKKRKIDSMGSMPFIGQDSGDMVGFTSRAESAGFRANAYSDVSIRPPPNARQTFGRSNYNPNQYGAFNLTPASQPPVQMTGLQAAVCRRGYDETGKLTNFFLPKEGDSRSMPRKKPIPSMQNLLNSQPRTSGQQQRAASNDRQEYALTNWLRNN
ncbi:hypothetical protein PF005_g9699 [Phytophthora fragariae]|uniref:RING-type domain-containing protein n=1 Tax=Phytophthora fragariae TaxID=53985 RepID=A0A6A3L2S6_9STRA|nr:hypothetical protein PF003_g23122 [Phytophthora fragariae]KAE8939361.1 hypothetical protein PF009_g10784 [Phytophthora fragariae]KAE9013289.1 hypothetical protein PF011_g8541 [Phytophthora fragariae]KAE9116432.1 hypothetical protein PF010_g8963 [Phytophthora fragariae]KAE9128351.1 hypothetical protein PF007_g5289 [Phytophthora fragariae]